MIECLLSELKEPMQNQWRQLLSLRHRVGMVSVLNKDQRYFHNAYCPALLSAHTHEASKQMYSYVLYNISAIRDVHFVRADDFFSIISSSAENKMKSILNNKKVDKKSQKYLDMKKKAMKCGYKHEDKAFAQALTAEHRLCFLTPLIHMTRAHVPSTFTQVATKSAGGRMTQRKITFGTKLTQDEENGGSTPLPGGEETLGSERAPLAAITVGKRGLPRKRKTNLTKDSQKSGSPTKKAKKDHLLPRK